MSGLHPPHRLSFVSEPLTPSDPTHASLLWRLAAAPEPSAWEEFHGRYGLLIRRYCHRAGLAKVDGDELLQEVFRALLQSLPSFRYDKAKGGFRAYLWRVVRNQSFALYKKRRPWQALPEDWTGDADPDQAWEEEWRKHHLREAFEQLSRENPATHMQVFESYVLQQRGADETAAACQCSVDMVYKVKSLLLARLRQIVQQRVELEG